jgi:hypothetical protein
MFQQQQRFRRLQLKAPFARVPEADSGKPAWLLMAAAPLLSSIKVEEMPVGVNAVAALVAALCPQTRRAAENCMQRIRRFNG